MRKINPALLGALAFWAFVFTFGAGPVHGQGRTLTFAMPACPIKATTVPPTKVPFVLPRSNPLAPFAITGTVQVTDQTSSTVILTQIVADTTLHGVDFARTVKTLQHATGQLTFDKGCTRTDPYGSNNCHWTWGESLTAAFQGALQEDIQAGRLIVDLKIDNTIPFQFSCPVCGASCTIPIPKQVDDGKFNEIWVLTFALIRFPLALTTLFPH